MKNTMRRIWAARALACGLAFGALAVERPPVAAPALEIPRVGMATLGVEEVTAVDAAPRVIAAESFRELKAWQPSGPSGSCAAMADADARTLVRLGQGRRWGFPHGVRPARPVPVVPSSRVTLSFQGRVPPGEASFVVYLRLFDAAGADVTEGVPAPSGWAYSDVSKAFYMAPLAPEKPHAWETFSCPLAVPEGVAGLLPFICPWRGEYVDCTAVELALRPPHRVTPCVFGAPEAVSNGVLRVTDPVRALRLEARTRAVSPEVTEVEAQVIDLAQPPRPRALRVTLALAADFAGGVWHRDLRTDVAIAPGASCAHAVPVGGHPVSRYPFDAASKNGRGVALGTPFDAPAFEARAARTSSACWRGGGGWEPRRRCAGRRSRSRRTGASVRRPVPTMPRMRRRSRSPRGRRGPGSSRSRRPRAPRTQLTSGWRSGRPPRRSRRTLRPSARPMRAESACSPTRRSGACASALRRGRTVRARRWRRAWPS